MKRPRKVRLVALIAGVLLAGFGSSAVSTSRTRAFVARTVTNTADSGPGSLRDAVAAALPGDTVVFNLALPAAINLTSGEIPIVSNITITGPGASQLTVSGGHLSRVFEVAINRTVTISGVTIANGTDIVDQLGGGGLTNGGALTVTNCNFSGNQAAGGGGGIQNAGTGLIVTNCTFDSNSTGGSLGGAILNAGSSLEADNCLFTNNHAFTGGAIFSSQGTVFVASNCTFAGNKAISSGGAIEGDLLSAVALANCTLSANTGGGITMLGGTFDLQNTIIADSTGGPDCTSVSPLGLNSHNLIKDGSCSPMLSGDPKLGPLQNNGGPTLTQALSAGSPAIDAGDDSVLGLPFSLTTDQRGAGFTRLSGLHVDIGAFEVQSAVPPPPPPPPAFDTCVQNGSLFLKFNSSTGAYEFRNCTKGVVLTGTGTLAKNGCKLFLNDSGPAKMPDRNVAVTVNTCTRVGTVSVTIFSTSKTYSFMVNDITQGSCTCP